MAAILIFKCTERQVRLKMAAINGETRSISTISRKKQRTVNSVDDNPYVRVQPGEGYSTKFRTGRLRPAVQSIILLYTVVNSKGTPLVYLPLTNGTPFTYLA